MTDIKTLRRWMLWQIEPQAEGKVKKTPLSPHGGLASVSSPETWGSYDEVKRQVKDGKSLGFVLGKEVGLVIVDFDRVRERTTDPWPEWVKKELEELDSYVEISVSGLGLHVLCFGQIPQNINRQKLHIELWDSNKMFSLTGSPLEGYRRTIESRDLSALYRRVVEERIGPSYRPALLATAHDSQKYQDVINDKWDIHNLDSRSSAVQSALVTLAIKHRGDRDKMAEEFEVTPLCSAWEERGKWSRLRERELDRALDFYSRTSPKTPPPSPALDASTRWFISSDDFLEERIEERRTLVTSGGSPFLLSKFLTQVFAYRGIGKTMFVHGLVNLLVNGGDFLTYKSTGGFRVALCDGELPDIELQERLKNLVGNSDSRLHLMTADRLPDKVFPPLSDPLYQQAFLEQVRRVSPDVIVFDTLSATHKLDTNDAESWMKVNAFWIQLRAEGYCVIVCHHAGKNSTQRGRSDGDDNLDLIIKLSPPADWTPGDGLDVLVAYEKTRRGGRLEPFRASWDSAGGWSIKQNDEDIEIIKLLVAGKTVKSISSSMDVTKQQVLRVRKRAQAGGLLKCSSDS